MQIAVRLAHALQTDLVVWTLALFCAAEQSLAAPESKSDWGNLKRLTSGEEIRVQTRDGKTLHGTFEGATEESFAIGESAGQGMLVRSAVLSVSVKGSSHRKRNALIGLGAGAAGGLILGAVADLSCNRNALLGCIVQASVSARRCLRRWGLLLDLGLAPFFPPAAGGKSIVSADRRGLPLARP